MSRCGCANNCNCVITDGCGIAVTGAGNPGAPYVVAAEIDDAVDNQLSCVPVLGADAGGLYVPPPSILVADTDCVNLSGVGTTEDPVSADLVLDPDACNLADCGETGLMVGVVVGESDCASLDGCGTLADPLIPSVRVSLDVGNVLDCRDDGLYVGSIGAGAIDVHGSMGSSAAVANAGGTTTDNSLSPFPWNVVQTDFGGITDIANDRFVIPVGGAGWYHVKAQWVENTATDSFEANANFVQVVASIYAPAHHLISQIMHPYMVHLPQTYTTEGVIYLNPGDFVYCGLSFTTGGVTNVLVHSWDSLAYSDGTYPCTFQIQRIGV